MGQSEIEQAAVGAVLEANGHGTGHAPGTELEMLRPGELATLLGTHVIPVREWVRALAEQEAFEESDEEDAALGIVRQILMAKTSQEAFAAMNTLSVKDLLGDKPGAATNVFEFYGASPLKSTFEEGVSCFCVIRALDLSENTLVTMSCGSRAVQAFLIAHMVQGWMPVKARFVRRLKPTRNGYYPVNLEAGI